MMRNLFPVSVTVLDSSKPSGERLHSFTLELFERGRSTCHRQQHCVRFAADGTTRAVRRPNSASHWPEVGSARGRQTCRRLSSWPPLRHRRQQWSSASLVAVSASRCSPRGELHGRCWRSNAPARTSNVSSSLRTKSSERTIHVLAIGPAKWARTRLNCAEVASASTTVQCGASRVGSNGKPSSTSLAGSATRCCVARRRSGAGVQAARSRRRAARKRRSPRCPIGHGTARPIAATDCLTSA